MPATDQPTKLRTEYVSNPLGIDETSPCLRWQVETNRRGARQTAFRVLVASARARLDTNEGDVWDSGKRVTGRPAVEYDGVPLATSKQYYWKVRVWDESGTKSEWSDAATWEMGLLDADDWEASWIRRSEDCEFEQGQFSYFRKTLTLNDDVKRARIYVSASHQYNLSINGDVVDQGQSFAYPDYQYYKTIDVTETLDAGDNVIGALHNWNGEGQGRPEGEPGFILRLIVDFADRSQRVVVTDESWRTTPAPWVDAPLRNGEIAEPVETIDGRQLMSGWNQPGFDDSDWEAVEVVGTHPTIPWERLIAQNRELTHTNIEPKSVERLESGSLVFDFGRVYAGVPVVTFESGSEGHLVELCAGYRREGDGTVSETEGTQWTDMRYRYIQRDGEQSFRPFNYLGFRYLQVNNPGEDLTIDHVSMVARHNTVPEPTGGTFESSNETVNDVAELARHSALYGCQEQFVDTPTREKGQFLMDACNISQVTTRAFGERRLSRQAVDEFVQSHYRYWAEQGRLNAVYPNGDGKRDIPDFTESFPEWVWQYYLVSDDRHTLETAYPVIRAIVDYIVRHIDAETGLIMNLSGGEGGPYEEGIVDWPREMRYGYDREWPARTTVNMLGVNALKRAEQIGAELSRSEPEIEYFRTRRQELETAIVEYLHVGDLFVDGCNAEEASTHASQHANAFALAFGLVPEQSTERVTNHIVEAGMQMGPMMVPWLLEALEVSDRPDAIVDLLTNPRDDGWANILEQGGTFTWESWHCRNDNMPDNERQNRSESHAMGATVFAYILRTLLGIRFDETTDRGFQISPPADGLDSASGRMPTECGSLETTWNRHDGQFELTVSVPWNTTATVSLPTSIDATVTVEGETLQDADKPSKIAGVKSVTNTSDGAIVDISAGTFHFVVK